MLAFAGELQSMHQVGFLLCQQENGGYLALASAVLLVEKFAKAGNNASVAANCASSIGRGVNAREHFCEIPWQSRMDLVGASEERSQKADLSSTG
jgi:hypothetical protein